MKKKTGIIGMIIGAVITLAAFGWIISRIFLYIDGFNLLDVPLEDMLVDVFIIVLGPSVLTIIWSIIRHRYLWLCSLGSIVVMGGVCGFFAENVTVMACLVAGYFIFNILLCMMANFHIYIRLPEGSSGDASSEGYGYSSSYSSSSSFPDSGAYGYPSELGPSYRPESTSAKDM